MASGNYRADHIGSLSPVPGTYGQFADDPIAGAVDAQLKAVLDVFTDGEPWRANGNASDQVAGAAAAAAVLKERAPSWAKLKVTLPAPGAADDADAVVKAAGELFAQEVAYIQFDASAYSSLDRAEALAAIAKDAELFGSMTVPEDSTTGLWVGPAAPLVADEPLADALFALPVDRFLIAFVDDSELPLLAKVPEDKLVVLGLIDASTPDLEEPESFLLTLDKAEELHGDRLAVSATGNFGPGVMSTLDQQKKLELVSDVSRMFWGTEL